jgi:fatty acid desaturase
MLHDILEHGAHHVNTAIPLYRLRQAQSALRNAVPNLARVEQLNWRRYWATVRACKLYDYANHQWMDFRICSRLRNTRRGAPHLSAQSPNLRAAAAAVAC